jgi:hypothetical protein
MLVNRQFFLMNSAYRVAAAVMHHNHELLETLVPPQYFYSLVAHSVSSRLHKRTFKKACATPTELSSVSF